MAKRYEKRAWASSGYKDAEALIGLAQGTVGIKEGITGLDLDVKHILIQLETIESFITEIESKMEGTLSEISCSIKLLSIKGLGVVSVAGIIGEVGDFMKFGTQSEIMKLAGLNLYEISSGKRNGERRISKRERSLLRKILYSAAIQTVNLTSRGNEENNGACRHSQKAPAYHICDREG